MPVPGIPRTFGTVPRQTLLIEYIMNATMEYMVIYPHCLNQRPVADIAISITQQIHPFAERQGIPLSADVYLIIANHCLTILLCYLKIIEE